MSSWTSSVPVLTAAQRERFERDGYLFFPGHFAPDEVRKLTAAVPELYARREVYNVREKGKDAVRTNFAAHLVGSEVAGKEQIAVALELLALCGSEHGDGGGPGWHSNAPVG